MPGGEAPGLPSLLTRWALRPAQPRGLRTPARLPGPPVAIAPELGAKVCQLAAAAAATAAGLEAPQAPSSAAAAGARDYDRAHVFVQLCDARAPCDAPSPVAVESIFKTGVTRPYVKKTLPNTTSASAALPAPQWRRALHLIATNGRPDR